MATNILISVSLVNKGHDNFQPETLLIPDDIAWIDFECLLKAHLDQENINVKYIDDDHDEVLISTNEEMKEAVKVARKSDYFLNIRVLVSETDDLKTDGGADIRPVPKPRTTEPAQLSKPVQEENIDTPEKLHDKLRSVQHLLEESEQNDHTEETGEIDPRLLNTDQETGTITVKKLKGIKKRDIYAVVASDISEGLADMNGDDEDRKRRLRRKPKRSPLGCCTAMSAPLPDQNVPYHLFVEYMEKLKVELRTEIVQDVTRKTVKHVLRGLENSPQKQSSLLPQPIHEGITCKHCKKTIVGTRYICGNCVEYDLCESCEEKHGIHDVTHIFLKMIVPCATAGYHDGQKRALLKRNIYRKHRPADAVNLEPKSLLNPSNEKILQKIAKVEEKFKRKDEKLQKREDKLQEKLRRKEEKLKRKLETQGERRDKREKLDLPQFRRPYFDFVDLGADFILDETIPDGTKVQPDTKLTKTWRVKNVGKIPWTDQTKIRLLWGGIPAQEESFSAPHLEPGQEGSLSVMLTAPEDPGKYQSHWKLDECGYSFGSRLWCSIIVDPKEVLEPTAPERSDSLLLMDNDHFAEAQETSPEESTPEPATSTEEQVSPTGSGEVDIQPSIQHADEEEVNIKEGEEPKDTITKDLNDVALAVAQLKVKSSDEDANRDLLSFEMVEKESLKPSQTGTPTNTPMGASSPKLEPERLPSIEHAISNSSSVEIVGDGHDTDTSYDMAEYVRERIQSLGLKPDIDVESLSSSDYDDDSSDASDDFYVVPLPDCFDTSKPLTRSTMETLEQAAGTEVDERVTMSMPDLSMDLREEASNAKVTKNSDDITESEVNDNKVNSSEPVNESATDIQPENREKDVADTSLTIEKELPETQAVEASSELTGATAAANPQNGNTKRQDSNPGVELVDQFMTTAVHAATKAAVQVYSTCKGVMHTLQHKHDEKSKVTYPQKNWTPPRDEWSPPKSDFKMPEDNFTLPEDTYQMPVSGWKAPQEWVPPKPSTPQDRLKEMGFCNKMLNDKLLVKYENDVERVVQELLSDFEETYGKDR